MAEGGRTELYVTPEGDVWCCRTCYRLAVAGLLDDADNEETRK